MTTTLHPSLPLPKIGGQTLKTPGPLHGGHARLNEAGRSIASVGKYAAPTIDVVAGGVCVVATDGICAAAIAANFTAQQALVADQTIYNPNYNWAGSEAAIVVGTGLGITGLGAVATSELGALGRAALGRPYARRPGYSMQLRHSHLKRRQPLG
jgi:hypothetical protein